jgi:hypothetical protein
VEASNNTSGDGANLTVVKGATVRNSIFNNNAIAGSGLVIDGSGALSLQNVEALNNQGKGLWLFTDNNITLTNIQSLNNPDGMTLDNSSAATPKTVTVNNGVFNDSTTGYGLEVKSRGSITLNHIDAEDNFSGGVFLDNGVTYLGTGSVSVLNTLGINQFIGNDGLGLNVFSKAAITVKGVYASGNVGGLSLDGCASTLPDPCLGKGNVTLSAVTVENNLATLNPDNGLKVRTGGAISLDGASFTGNTFGVVLDNSSVITAKTVAVKNSSFNNTSDPTSVGLVVKSKGSITLNNVVANSNLGHQVYGPDDQYVSGILLDNCILNAGLCTGSGKVSVLSSLGLSEVQDNNQGDGLFILSKAAISITGFSSTGNGGGAYLNNASGTGAVSITNSTFSNNAGVPGGLLTGTYGGLVVRSTRGITLNGVEASENDSGAGADLSNEAGLTTSDAVMVNKSHFGHNTDSGLLATAKGSLTLNNVSVNHNNSNPANDGAAILRSVNGGITILDKLGPNQFSYNQNNGLVITADNGAISLTGVTASDNSTGTAGIGMILANASAITARPITVQKTVASNNHLGGLDITSKGVVTLNGVHADSNANGWGAHIDNCVYIGFCEGSGGVSILSTLGANSMSYNRFGMQIFSAGSVAINATSASHNLGSSSGKSGVWIDNHYTPGKTITVNKSNFDSNSGTGVFLVSAGAITLNNIGASRNVGGSGVEARNPGAIGDAGVSILSTLGINQFNGNSGNGLNVFTDGNIVLNKVMVSDNGFIAPNDGAVLRTINASSVTITCSVFNHNQGYGLSVNLGTGPVIFKSVGANKNLGPADYNLPPLLVPTMSWVVCGY